MSCVAFKSVQQGNRIESIQMRALKIVFNDFTSVHIRQIIGYRLLCVLIYRSLLRREQLTSCILSR